LPFQGEPVAAWSTAVKIAVALLVCLMACGGAFAQEQEQKLVDRLLRPNTEMKNSSQDKRFYGAGMASLNKKASAKPFYISQKTKPPTFADNREFATREHISRTFADTGHDNTQVGRTATTAAFVLPKITAPKAAAGTGKQTPVGDYAGNRAFTEKGKSQKSLDRKNAPMTIDQVRDLLNRNK
jgi:hypothetical protein